MIGGLALAGATADISDPPPSPKPARGVRSQVSVSSTEPGLFGVIADGAQELHSQVSGGADAAAGPNGQGPDSEDQDQAGNSGGSGGSHARLDDVAGTRRQIGAGPASHYPAVLGQDNAALGQNSAAPAAGLASGAAGMSDSIAAGAAAGLHTSPRSNGGTQVVNSNGKGGHSSSNAAADSAARQDPTGNAGSGMGPQGAPAGPPSIAAYRPEGRADIGGSGSGVGSGQGGPTGLSLDESWRRQSVAGEKSHRSGGGDVDAGRLTKSSGQPVQVRVCLHVCRQSLWLVTAHAKAASSLLCINSHFCYWQLPLSKR